MKLIKFIFEKILFFILLAIGAFCVVIIIPIGLLFTFCICGIGVVLITGGNFHEYITNPIVCTVLSISAVALIIKLIHLYFEENKIFNKFTKLF